MNGDLLTQRWIFLEGIASQLGRTVSQLRGMPSMLHEGAIRCRSIRVRDPYNLSDAEIRQVASAFYGRYGVAAFDCVRADLGTPHPLVAMGQQLARVLPCHIPIRASVESEVHRIMAGGTAGVLAATDRAQSAHQDGLHLNGRLLTLDANAVAVSALWTESPPLELASTFVQNLTLLSLELWRSDEEAFTSLFAPDAIRIENTITGKSSISPVLAVSESGPAFVYQAPDEYLSVTPGNDREPTSRALDFLESNTRFGSPGSCSIEFDRPGRGIIMRNEQVVHGRTSFVDGLSASSTRVIANMTWSRRSVGRRDLKVGLWHMRGHCGSPVIVK